MGAGHAAQGVGGARQEPRRAGRRNAARPPARLSSTSAARSTCCGTASSCSACKQPLKLAEFKPALAINPDILARYAANRLRVVRQVRYSLHNENCLDLVLFLNGVPVATVELKTDFTQSIDDAIDQYRFDRLPQPKGQAAEPLLSFPERRAGAFRGQQQRSPHDDAAGRAGDRLPALQPGRRRRGGQPGEPERRPPHGLPVGAGLGAARAGWRSWAAT